VVEAAVGRGKIPSTSLLSFAEVLEEILGGSGLILIAVFSDSQSCVGGLEVIEKYMGSMSLPKGR